MSCKKKCSSSSSSSPTSKCSVPTVSSPCSKKCYPVKCKDKCKKRECKPYQCRCIEPEVVRCKRWNAVVNISAEFILVGPTITTAAQVVSAPLGTGVRADIIRKGQGWFYQFCHDKCKELYIITTADYLFLSPTVTLSANRYPFLTSPPPVILPVSGSMLNTYVRASRVLVDVYDVNNSNKSYAYEASIVAADPLSNICILKINNDRTARIARPKVENCNYLTFAESKKYVPGLKTYTLNNPLQVADNFYNGEKSITVGHVVDNRYVDHNGWILHESVVISNPGSAFTRGSPILNCSGGVIGMIAGQIGRFYPFNENPNYLQRSDLFFGPSQRAIEHVICTLIRADRDFNKFKNRVNIVTDPAGAYYVYKKGYLGLGYRLIEGGADFTCTEDFSIGAGFPHRYPRVILTPNGGFETIENCNANVGIKGLRIVAIAGRPNNAVGNTTSGSYFIPGASSAAPFAAVAPFLAFEDSPFVNTPVNCDDILIGITDCNSKVITFGDLPKQIAPTLLTYKYRVGQMFKFKFVAGLNLANSIPNGGNANNNLDQYFEVSSQLKDFPPGLDYPYYAAGQFGNIFATYGFSVGPLYAPGNIPQLALLDSIFTPAI